MTTIMRTAAMVAGAGALLASQLVSAQYNESSRYLTVDGYWHNRYHGLLSMAAYGDYNVLCPEQTFTEEAMLSNFPNSQFPPWDVISTFGPTASGAEGFTAIVPEMNKALIIFKGDFDIEANLGTDVVSWSEIGLGDVCSDCTVNAQAARAYNEVLEETNGWQDILDAYYNNGLVFSITGHGFGGMLSQIASVDMNVKGHCWYSHAYSNPRVFNQAGADWYNQRFNGEAGERGLSGKDDYSEFIPAGPDYAHAGTTFYYWGINSSTGNPNWKICWNDEDQTPCAPGAEEQPWDDETTAEMDKYHYFCNVQQCGGSTRPNVEHLRAFVNSGGTYVLSDDDAREQAGVNGEDNGDDYYTTSTSSSYRYRTSSSTANRGYSTSSPYYGRTQSSSSSSRSYGYPPQSSPSPPSRSAPTPQRPGPDDN